MTQPPSAQPDLYRRIGQFYDASSQLWEQVWGEHMHHGYYGPTGTHRKDRYQAQIDLMEELLTWGGVTTAHTILDAGCGIGGATLFLAQKFQARAAGLTLSPVQAERARARAQEHGVRHQPLDQSTETRPTVEFRVADALHTPFPDNHFDLVWTLESGEHMPDKRQFLQECYRQLKPGGTFLMATWCHRATHSLAGPLTRSEQEQLQAIYDVYCLPYVISLPDYEALAWDIGFQDVKAADWSTAVEPFWDDVIRSALDPVVLFKLLQSGGTTLDGALSLRLMSTGFQRGLIRYGLVCGRKP
ncbi:MAG: methyltransferase domain-containing protein [Cyanobacteria bacterium J06632_22]